MKKLLMTPWIILCCTFLYAQQTDFSGTWLIRDQRSVSGKLYANGSPKQMNVIQNKEAMTIVKITTNGDGNDVTTNETVSFDGKQIQSTTPSGRTKRITVKWSDDQKIFSETVEFYSSADNSREDYKVTDTWNREDGKLVLLRKNENFMNGEVWISKSVYERQ